MLGIYCRISVDKKGQTSIETQQEMGIEFAKEHKMKYKVYIDRGISGTLAIKDRPQFEAMLNDIEDEIVTDIYATNQDRLERSEVVWFTLVEIMDRKKVTLYENGEKVAIDDDSIRMLQGMKTLMNADYARKTSRKVTNKVKRNFQQGKAHGSIPYGYMKNENKVLVVDPAKAKIVKRIFNEEIQGSSISKITKGLNKDNIASPRGAKWSKGTVTKMLSHRMYIGERPYKETYVPIPPIISKDTFKQARLARKKNELDRGKINLDRFYLRDLLFCDVCGNRYLGNKSKYPYYQCATRRLDSTACTSKNIRASFLEEFVWFVLRHELLDEIKAMKDKDTGKEKLEIRQEEKVSKLKDLKKQEKRLTHLAVTTELNPEYLNDELSRIEREQGTAQKELDEVEVQLKSYEVEDTSELLTLKDFDKSPNEFKKMIAKKFINKIVIGEELDGVESINIYFNVKNISLSVLYDTKKGFIIDQFRPYLYLTGKMLIKEYESSNDQLGWFSKKDSINKLHQIIVEKSRKWRYLLKGDYSIEPPYITYVPLLVEGVPDESVRQTFLLHS